MTKWTIARALETAATGAVLVAAVIVILQRAYPANNEDGWSAIDPIQIAFGASPSLGNTQAARAVMVFADFECQFCQIAADGLMPWLKVRI